MAGKIFVNYRREDSRSEAARLRDRLARVFGESNVFMDVDNLVAGQRFDQELEKALVQCDVLLAVIGPRWRDVLVARAQAGGRDYVREEIAQALQRGVTVVPVLIEGAPLPSPDDLAEDIKPLVLHQKHEVTHERFGRDVEALVDAIRFARGGRRRSGSQRRMSAATAGISIATVLLLAGAGLGAAVWGGLIELPEVSDWRGAATAARQERGSGPRVASSQSAPREPAFSGAATVEPLRWRMPTAFPKSLEAYMAPARDLAEKVGRASAGQVRIEPYAAGEIVPGLQVLDAVSKDVVEAGWTIAAYHIGKDVGFGIMSGRLPLGFDTNTLVRWAQTPAGAEARERTYEPWRVHGMPCAVVGSPGLWMRKAIRSMSDLRGAKIRTAGSSTSIARKLGAVPVVLPGGEVVPAMERGVIGGAEWSTPLLDHQAGLHKVAKNYYFPFWDASSATLVDLIVNRDRWDNLSRSAQSLLTTACREQLLGSLLRIPEDERAGLRLLAKEGVTVGKLPSDISEKARDEAWAEVDAAAKKSATAARLKESLAAMR